MEANSADRWMLQAAALSGLILLAADGIRTWERLHLVLKTFVWCSAYMAVIGIAQAVLFFDLTTYMLVPGLVEFVERTEFMIRGGGVRVASTTAHYIEFSVVMALAFPFAIHYALHGDTRRMRQIYALLTLLIAAAIPATVSRTGFVALAIVVVILVPLWGWRTRYHIAIMGAAVSAVLIAAKPSLASTLITMFETVGSDESITSRTDRYDMVYDYFVERPWFGRGSGTWVSPQYQYLDNQWLSMVLTNGIVGVAVLLAIHVTAIVLATVAMRRATTVVEKHITAGLVSTQLVAVAVGATFDSLSFTTCAIMVMLLAGLCGAVWRLTHADTAVRTAAVPGD
jgi:O-antigen ligase